MLLKKNNSLDCILVGSKKVNEKKFINDDNESFEELASLAYTLGLKVVDTILLPIRKISSSIYYGKGQIESLKNKASLVNAKIIVFNDEITPAQYKNLQKILEKKSIFDRTGIILEIFKNNAKTKESKYQVELATLQYMLPRLTRFWTHLERQMGGTGTRGGPGEKQIEIDRRLISSKISKLKKDLEKIRKNRHIQASSRKNIFRVSLVGYTNAGKSSLLNSLSKPNTSYVQDKLFATLDTTTRKIENSRKNKEFLLTDTVGLIRDLPHNLVASFRSTFEEVKESDLILTVVDSSNDIKIISNHIQTIESTLDSMSINAKNNFLVFNKVDKGFENEKIKYLNKKYPNSIMVSAKDYVRLDVLLDKIHDVVKEKFIIEELTLSYDKFSIINQIYSRLEVISRKDSFKNIKIKVSGSPQLINKIKLEIEEKNG